MFFIDILNLILSSAVIVAIINMIVQNKNNKLQYITAERSEWRKEIKKCAIELEKCSSYGKKCKKIFAKLKVNLNSYGCCADGEYPEDEKLDILQDQHIWKEMHSIETGTKAFQTGKKHMQEYLSLLLKFDWERSKEEVKTDNNLIVSIVLYWLSIGVVLLFHKDLYGEDNTLNLGLILAHVIIFMPSFMFLWGIRFIDAVKSIRKAKWYKMTSVWLIFWMIGMLSFVLFYIVTILEIQHWIAWIGGAIGFLLFIMSFSLMADSTAEKKRRYMKYENALIKAMSSEEQFMLYLYKATVRELIIEDRFQKFNIMVDWTYLHNASKQVDRLLNEIRKKEKDNVPWEDYIHWRSKVRYHICHALKKADSLEEFVLRRPQSLKPILKYKQEFYVGYWAMLRIQID